MNPNTTNPADPNPSLETIRDYFPKLSETQRKASREYGILSFDGNDKTTDDDLERGMAAAAAIAKRCSLSDHAAGLI